MFQTLFLTLFITKYNEIYKSPNIFKKFIVLYKKGKRPKEYIL